MTGHPAGITWAGDYNQVTLVDIARGAPTSGRGKVFVADDGDPSDGFAIANRAVQQLSVPSAERKGTARAPKKNPVRIDARRIPDLETIPPASLNEYGPDSKAAAVLTGANVLFDTLSPIIHDALQLLCTKEDQPVADLTRALIWTFLIGETLRSQPALFSAAFQARGVQRALDLGIQPVIDEWMGEGSTRSEFGTKEKAGGTRTPTALEMLDTLTLPSLRQRLNAVEENVIKDGAAEDAMDQPVSAYDLATARIVRRVVELHLRGNTAQLKVVEGPDGARTVDGFVRFPQLALTAMQELALGDLRHPFDSSAPGPFRDATWNFADPEHLETLLPHVPTSLELKRLPRESQVATLMAGIALGRLLREIKERQSGDLPSAVRVSKDFSRRVCHEFVVPLAENARDALSADDPIVVLCQLVANRTIMKSVCDEDPDPQAKSDRELLVGRVQAVLKSVEATRDCVRNGAITMAQYTEIWIGTSPIINEVRQVVARFDESYSRQVVAFLIEQWAWTEAWWKGNASAMHNYAGLLIVESSPASMRKGVEIASAVLRKRREIDRFHGDLETTASFRTRQVIVRGMTALVRVEGNPLEVAELNHQLLALLGSPVLEELVKDGFQLLSGRQYTACWRFIAGYLEVRKAHQGAPVLRGAALFLCDELERYIGENAKLPNGTATVQECQQVIQEIRTLDGVADA